MDIKRGSVTPVDLTGQADGDYIRNDAGIYKPKTPSEVLQNMAITDLWTDASGFDLPDTATVGTGNITYRRWRQLSFDMAAQAVGAGIPSTIRVSTILRQTSWSLGKSYIILDFNKTIILQSLSSVVSTLSPNSQRWILLGQKNDDPVADPTSKCIGFRADGNALFGIAHNGTTLTSIALAPAAYLTATLRSITVISHAGQVYWYVDRVLRGETALGPTGDSGSQEQSLRILMDNHGDHERNQYLIHQLSLYVEQ